MNSGGDRSLLIRLKSDSHFPKINFKIHDVTTWLTDNYSKHIAQNLTK